MLNWDKEKFLREFIGTKEFQRALAALTGGESVVWDGCVGSSYALIASALAQATNRTILVATSKVGDVDRARADVEFFSSIPTVPYPLLSDDASFDSDDVFLTEDPDFGARIRALSLLADRVRADSSNETKTPLVVVSSLAAMLQPVPSRDAIVQDTIELAVDSEFCRDDLTHWLKEGRFVSTTAVELPGEFSVRGYIVDVFASGWERPVRLEFYGDVVDSIREFEVADQRSVAKLQSIRISRLHASGRFDARFVDHLPNDAIVLLRDTDLLIGETNQLVNARGARSSVESRSATVAETVNALLRHPTIHAVNVASGAEFAQVAVRGNFGTVERLQGHIARVETAFDALAPDERPVIACVSEAEARRLYETFKSNRPGLEDRLSFTVGALSGGFEDRGVKTLFIGADQLFDRSISRRARPSNEKALKRAVDSFMELSEGELVVHVDYGIARYCGLQQFRKANQLEDFLTLEFADRKIYVSASKIGKIQRYFGVGDPQKVELSKSDGKSWARKKEEARRSVCEYAAEMLRLQAERESLQGIAFPPDGEWQREFEASFPYNETEDQLAAIAKIKADMERVRPMDRLLCGDVGFGKTEVALRAAFKAVEAGFQVAVLSPTTVLTEQHYRTFCDRAAQFPIKIASLSRYSSKKEQQETIQKIKDGMIDVVIGTHRILSKDVEFKRLGLVVIDEEQKFGVAHKERFKQFRNTVDILTMSATPIPRTLHMSLLGIRDISQLETPPADRLPVETKATRRDDQIIRNAILKELNRGGQAYYLHNRVVDMNATFDYLTALVPEARVRIGHAQMSSFELESTMRDFVLHRFDVLLCTTIIESGVDIPNANTMFVDNADQFGLAELHQLRGRVGREKKQAYCYLMVDPDRPLNQKSLLRLRALEEYSKLGAGFHIAMKDLEIRGAGNILGVKQSGHIGAVGYEMYCEFLEAAVRAIKCEPQKLRVDVALDLPGAATLPDDYIPDSSAKIDFYRRLDRVSTYEDVDRLYDEMVDRFGRPANEVERLFKLARIRIAAFAYRVKSLKLAQTEGLPSFGRNFEIIFRSQESKFRLQDELNKRGIALHAIDELEGRVDLPRDLFTAEGAPCVEELLEYALRLFLDPNKTKRQSASTTSNAAAKRDSSKEKTVKTGSMRDALKRMKQKKGDVDKPQ